MSQNPCSIFGGCSPTVVAGQQIPIGLNQGGLNPNISGTRYNVLFDNFKTVSFEFRETGAVINSVFPIVRRIAQYRFNTTVGLIAARLTTSIIAETAGVCHILLAKGNTDVFDVNGTSEVYLDHLTQQNSIAGIPNPNTSRTQISFGDGTVIRVQSNETIGLYASAPVNAANLLVGLATLYYIPING